ncbi:MAG: metallophosphatase family protein [Vallitalea sp.]|jgi:predicted phosphodiesterase|nr:metallophosphatase family protein [Vallitalea sp.]
MSRIAIISDIHGNIPALDAVLKDIKSRNINRTFCLGHRVYLSTAIEERMKLFMPTKTLNEEADVVGYGDIHGAHIDNFNGKTIFNVGSVGNPLEITQASYAIIEGKYKSKEKSPLSISLVRVPYNIEQAVRDAMESDMPDKQEYINELRTAVYRGRKKK